MGFYKCIAFDWNPNILEQGMEYSSLHTIQLDIDSLIQSKLFLELDKGIDSSGSPKLLELGKERIGHHKDPCRKHIDIRSKWFLGLGKCIYFDWSPIVLEQDRLHILVHKILLDIRIDKSHCSKQSSVLDNHMYLLRHSIFLGMDIVHISVHKGLLGIGIVELFHSTLF